MLPNKANKMLLFEAQYTSDSVQKPAVRLFLIGKSLVLVDYVWNLCDPATAACRGGILRAPQTNLAVTLSDGLWHFIAVSLSTNRNNIPSSLADPDLIYLYGTRYAICHSCCFCMRDADIFVGCMISLPNRSNCTGPSVTALVGSDLCDRPDIETMLRNAGSDRIKCIHNPGAAKRVRFGFACHSAGPPLELGSMIHGPSDDSAYSYLPPFDGHNWYNIGGEDNFTVPTILKPGQAPSVMIIFSVLFCRSTNGGTGECADTPIRGATRVASASIDGQTVAQPLCNNPSCSHVPFISKLDRVCCCVSTALLLTPSELSFRFCHSRIRKPQPNIQQTVGDDLFYTN